MKFLWLILLLTSTCAVFAQGGDVLATAKGKTFTAADLPPEAQKLYAGRNSVIADVRKQLLTSFIYERLLEAEAAAKGVSTESLSKAAKSNVPPPAEAQIKAVYDANRGALGNLTLDQTRSRIVEFLRHDAENAAFTKYVDTLAVKYKRTLQKDVNAPDLKPGDSLATINGKPLTAAEFESKFRLALNSEGLDLYDEIQAGLTDAIYAYVLSEDAASQKTDVPGLIAREVTNKLREFSDEERSSIETAFRNRLFDKYSVKILLKSPEPLVQAVSVDDDPAVGPENAPVTVVMFSDFQCPACSATDPVLKQVLAEYPGKIRFVVRDFPLLSLHENAFGAALAANAAHAQGKFFEYTEILYKHQDALDPASLKKYAAELGLNAKRFELDLTLEKTAAEVRKDMMDGKAYGITGTPTIFVNGISVRNLSVQGFRDAIENALKGRAQAARNVTN